ncbi:MAG: hypothetical protein ACLFRL_07045 [Desulfohalobiaceae bacterium]
MSITKQSQIVQEIYSLLCRDQELKQQTLHSLHSLWGIDGPQQLRQFLEQAGDSEIQTLLELVLFPDQDCKLRIHSCLQGQPVSAAQQSEILKQLQRQNPRARLFFPGHAQPVQLQLDPENLDWFLQRLQLQQRLDPELHSVLQQAFPPHEALRISLAIKSRSEPQQGSRKELLLAYLSRASFGEPEFWPSLNLLLDLTQEMDPGAELWSFLVRKKLQLEHSLRLAQRLSQQLNTQPMELLLMQRVSILCIDQQELREQIHYLDLVCLLLFSRVPETELPLSQSQYTDLGH